MSRLMRKNLMVEDEKLKALAQRRGLTESETVRQLVDHALAADEIISALDDLAAMGGIDDVYHRVDGSVAPMRTVPARRERSPR